MVYTQISQRCNGQMMFYLLLGVFSEILCWDISIPFNTALRHHSIIVRSLTLLLLLTNVKVFFIIFQKDAIVLLLPGAGFNILC